MSLPPVVRAGVILNIVAGFLAGCRLAAPRLRPPTEVHNLQGYASVRLSGDRGSIKTRFLFQVRLPSQGRIEVFDVLGRVLFTLVIEGEEARFVLHSEKVYWQAPSGEVIARLMGFSLSLEEWAALISGLWENVFSSGTEAAGWTLVPDSRGRIVSGRKGDILFEVKEFFTESLSPRRLSFEEKTGQGTITVLDLRFNVTGGDASLALSLPASYQARSWEQVERLMRRED